MGVDGVKELITRLGKIEDAYDDFILGVVNFAKRNPSHVDILNKYLCENDNATSCDVIAFIARQPDFHEYSAVNSAQKII